MKEFLNRIFAAAEVLFKQDVIVMIIYHQDQQDEHAELWSTIDDDQRLGRILKLSGKFLSPDPGEMVNFENQKN